MLSDEEKKAIKKVKYICDKWYDENLEIDVKWLESLLSLCEKQQKEIEEIEELKEERKSYAEEYIHNNPWLYKQLNENYILRVESEQKERKAYIKGTNDSHELCNKKWKDKIKAKIEEIDEVLKGQLIEKIRVYFEAQKEVLQSLLEKE